MRFSIRDLLWATLVVAMGLGWWISYGALDARQRDAVQQTQRHRAVLRAAKKSNESLNKFLDDVLTGEASVARVVGPGTLEKEPGAWPDWSILDEPLIEP